MKKILIIFLYFNCFSSFKDHSFKILSSAQKINSSGNYLSMREKGLHLMLDILETSTHCLRIMNPTKDQAGELFWIEKEEGQCLNKTSYKIGEIVSFDYKLQQKNIEFKYSFLEDKSLKEEHYSIPMVNMIKKQKLNRRLYSVRDEYDKKYSKLWLDEGLGLKVKSKKENEFCYKVDSTCKVLEEYSCESCINGWIEVVGSGCLRKSNRICYSKGCGGVDEPACDSGILQNPLEKICSNQKRRGTCQKGLRLVCLNQNQLWCKDN